MTFGWFKKLNPEQLADYHQSVTHALLYAENGQRVSWYRQNASGYAVPVVTWPNGSGYCRRLHVEAIAYNVRRVKSATACFSNNFNQWRWVEDK